MPESYANSRITSDKQIFFINREKIAGVQSIDSSMPTNATITNFAGLGAGRTSFAPVGEQIGDLSINALLINQDYFLTHVTGNSLINAYILRNQSDKVNNYSIISGYLTNYQCQYSAAQQIPQISTNIKAIGDMGKIAVSSFETHHISDLNYIAANNFTNNNPKIPSIGSIDLGIDDFNTNRVLSFNISINSNKIPVYNMGNRKPKRVDLLYPIDVDCNFTFDLGGYDVPFLRGYPSNNPKNIENLTVTVNDYNDGTNITTYTFNNLNLIDTKYQNSTQGNVLITTTFKGQISF